MTTQTALKSYFEHGDIPSGSQFTELIDTMFELFNNAQATSNAAVTTANAALAAANTVSAARHLPGVSSGTTDWSANVASVTYHGAVGQQVRVRVNFTTAYADADYFVIYSTAVFSVAAKSLSYIELLVTPSATVYFEVAVFGKL